MKTFFQSLLGSLTAFVILMTLTFIGMLAFIGAIAMVGSESGVAVEPGSVLIFDLNTTIQDTPSMAEIGSAVQEVLSGGAQSVTYLLKVVDAIERAKTDDDISALLLQGSLVTENYGSGLGAVSEVREALESFKASGKKIYAYVLDPSQKDYYLVSVADEIWLNPFGMISLNGLTTNGPFLGSTLEKYGIGVQTTRVGRYKAAVEMFTRTEMSEADREQKIALLNDLWSTLLAEISVSRGIGQETVLQLSSQTAFFTATDALAVNLADRVGYLDELIDYLASAYQPTAAKETFKQIDLIEYAEARGFQSDTVAQSGERIAVVYAEGEIIAGGYIPDYVGSDWLAYELRRLRQDDSVKAVVLRVNSPGGSAVGSEITQRETRLLAEQKPLIVSMGSYAASGGYWISAYADKIYAQPYTITGSIGVFGLVFNVKDAAENLAVYFDGVKTSPFADIYSVTRPRTDVEMALIQKFTDEIYEAFINKVAEGRSIEPSAVREIAQGRVWSGLSAKDLLLVDEIGGLNDAIYAAFDLGGGDFRMIEQVPAQLEMADALAAFFEESGAAPVAKSSNPFTKVVDNFGTLANQLHGLNDPRGVYTRMPYGLEDL